MNIGGVSIADYTFAEVTDVSGLGISYSLGKFDGIGGMAWGFHFCGRSSYSSGRSEMLARSPSSPSTLEIKSMES